MGIISERVVQKLWDPGCRAISKFFDWLGDGRYATMEMNVRIQEQRVLELENEALPNLVQSMRNMKELTSQSDEILGEERNKSMVWATHAIGASGFGLANLYFWMAKVYWDSASSHTVPNGTDSYSYIITQLTGYFSEVLQNNFLMSGDNNPPSHFATLITPQSSALPFNFKKLKELADWIASFVGTEHFVDKDSLPEHFMPFNIE